MASATPKIVLDSLKDPKKQASHIQDQLQEQFHQIGDSIGQKIEETIGSKIDIDEWINSSKNERILELLEKMNAKIDSLEVKIEKLNSKKK